ncbi:unnamed protein product [Eruca vesicaria subsp. sativa]|uniref:Uncharacterized protein n=1 Tax=Eruca vesicaria subsp. sativa TaxID=29727 RepID=A0ABC8JNZ5_ERUVS|nr:unnamed protein product [Eruca vesicaria subsp. sativa]
MATNEPEHRDVEEAGANEDTGAQVAPIIRLEEVAVTTGEEDAVLDLTDGFITHRGVMVAMSSSISWKHFVACK